MSVSCGGVYMASHKPCHVCEQGGCRSEVVSSPPPTPAPGSFSAHGCEGSCWGRPYGNEADVGLLRQHNPPALVTWGLEGSLVSPHLMPAVPPLEL